MSDYLEILNREQRKAVEQVEGPVLIMAGAGSGKTKALTCRIAYMLEQGIAPGEILAITFTNKAAQEMKERVHGLVGPAANKIWMYTFHAFGARFLRREIKGYPPYTDRFTIYDSDDSRQVIKNIIKDFNLDDKQYQPRAVQSRISSAKNALLGPKGFRETVADNFHSQKIADIYDEYDRRMKSNNALDFDDLLFITTALLALPSIRKRWQDRFHYILIDEYQDTNHAQYLMAKYIAGSRQNICAVGDADQSIYSWRGADLRNILEFQQDYPKAKVIKMEQNYRSTKVILQAANAVIKNNINRPSKRLWTENTEGPLIQNFRASDEHEEADYIARQMIRLHEKQQRPYGDMAVLYRMNAQSRVLEESLVKRGIAYTMVGSIRFYDRAEIRDILAYLKLINNFRDDISFMRIINVPRRGIGNTTVEKLQAFAKEKGISLFEAVMSVDSTDLKGAAKSKLIKFNAMIFDFLNAAGTIGVFELIKKIMNDTGYLQQLQESKDPQAEARVENLGELLSVAAEFEGETPEGGVQEFLEKVALVNDVDTYEEKDDRVTLMTMHSAKGLEFPVVFVAGMDEGIFPGVRSLMDDTAVEEERRLCYVAITRAREALYLCGSSIRTMYGQLKPYAPSRFMKEIPDDLMKTVSVKKSDKENRYRARAYSSFQSKAALSDAARTVNKTAPRTINARFDWKVGDVASHAIWGKGRVIEVSGTGKNMIVKIEFPGNNVRQLMVAFAPITKEG